MKRNAEMTLGNGFTAKVAEGREGFLWDEAKRGGAAGRDAFACGFK